MYELTRCIDRGSDMFMSLPPHMTPPMPPPMPPLDGGGAACGAACRPVLLPTPALCLPRPLWPPWPLA